MQFDFETLEKKVRYKLLCAFVAPRPIALVTTVSTDGVPNAAPFSFFNVFGDEPPIVILGIQNRPDGRPKDTTKNIKDTGEFVVHLVDRPLGPKMVDCAVDFEPEVDELAELGLELVPSTKVAPGRIVGAPAALECRLETTLEYPGRSIVVGRVVNMHVRDDCIDPETLYIDTDAYRPIARLHADYYIETGGLFEIHRLNIDEYRAREAEKG